MYIFGYAHLGSFVGMSKAFLLGILPFIAGDLLKTVICVRILKTAFKGMRFKQLFW
jgi:biotin transporter BioY